MIPGAPLPSPGDHVVAMPYPGRGHINPMMNLCSLLLSSHDLTITFILTEEWLALVGPISGSPNLRLLSIPNVVPSEHTRGNNFIRFFEAVLTEMEAPFERFLDQLDRPVSCIIADTWLPWMAVVGGRRNVPVLSLWTQAPSMFSIFYHFELLAAHKHFPDEDLQERGEEVIDYLPGLSPMRLVDLPNVIVGKEGNVLKMLLDAFSFVTKAQGLIFTSWYELQPQVTSALKADLPIPVYTIGPSIPYFSLQSPSSNSIPSYFRWLDSQPESSVLFVSLGSYIPLSSDQMEEIFMGLNASQIRYLWIVRGEISSLQGACGELGLIVPWCEQLRVLCHPSVGGFMTHCGWNSVMEGIFAGVPMLGFPLAIDQFHNCKLIVEDWKIGLRLKKRVESRHVVGREDVAQSVKRLMNLNGSERIKLIRSAQELEETCTRAIKKGGSTDKNVNDFVKDFVKGQ